MDCPRPHEWYELERGAAARDDAARLRRHQADCDDCRDRADRLRHVAAGLELLAGRTRADVTPVGEESLRRRAQVHGLLGPRLRTPLTLRLQKARALKVAVPLVTAVAAALLVAIGVHLFRPPSAGTHGPLDRLIREVGSVESAEGLAALHPLARAAVGEELARAEPDPEHVADLLLVAYITAGAQEGRQVEDVRFLVDGVYRVRAPETVAWACGGVPLASILPVTTAAAETESLPAEVAAALREGRYDRVLAALPPDRDAPALRAWCLAQMGQAAEAAQVLAYGEDGPEDTLVRTLWAHLALEGENAAEAMRQYETLAETNTHYWFAAGYLARYELGDMRGAGLRFRRVEDERLARYCKAHFRAELAAAERGPMILVAETFDDYAPGEPSGWALVRSRGGEFRVVDAPGGGRALEQDEINLDGAEILTGLDYWGNYTLQFDVQILDSMGDYIIGAAAYRRADHTGYVLELAPNRLRLVKQFAMTGGGAHGPERVLVTPRQAEMHLTRPPAKWTWYTIKIRVHRKDDGVSVAGKMWDALAAEPLGWQIAWTDAGQAGPPLPGGAAGVQITGARVLIDNLTITRNAPLN